MDTEMMLESIGFKNKWEGQDAYPNGEYWDENGNKKVCLKGDGVYAYSVDRSSVYGDPYLELHLNFAPDPELLSLLLKRVFYL